MNAFRITVFAALVGLAGTMSSAQSGEIGGSIALRVEGALLDRSLCGSVAGWNLSSRRLWA